MKKALIAGVIIAAAAVGSYLFLDKKIDQQVKLAFDDYIAKTTKNGTLAKVSYQNIDASPFGTAKISDLTITPVDSDESIRIHQIQVKEFDQDHATPHYMNLAIKGFTLPVNLQEAALQTSNLFAKYVEQLGYTNHLPLTFNVSYEYDESDQQHYVSEVSSYLPDVGHAKLNLVTNNIPLELLMDNSSDDKNDMQTMQTLRNGQLKELSLAYSDTGAIEALMKIASEQSKQSESDLRKQIKQALEMNTAIAIPPDLADFRTQLLASLETFMLGGKSLTLAIAPSENGDIALLETKIKQALAKQDLKKVVSLLNLTITAADANQTPN
ncbi:hypothetical protein [Gayadomonas joobiniege]|uniref:hypothetical protein n=1 Tax=Gayadomonas joobiniege TaxID=1234606 RepID=UPI00036F448D|nr:hypothetical protein [Gayadomonas joobiniege]